LWIVSNNSEGGYWRYLSEAQMQMIKLQERMIEKYKMTDEDFDEIKDLAMVIEYNNHYY
jgi:exopolyphosphatase/pppGpp-phosphohydrolase